jgi:hypothetical protein
LRPTSALSSLNGLAVTSPLFALLGALTDSFTAKSHGGQHLSGE